LIIITTVYPFEKRLNRNLGVPQKRMSFRADVEVVVAQIVANRQHVIAFENLKSKKKYQSLNSVKLQMIFKKIEFTDI
jgi:hypothetical protein